MPPRRAATLADSFRYAFGGLFETVRSQRNMRIHLGAALCVLVLGLVAHVGLGAWLALILAATLVMAAELMNRAVEAAVDVATDEWKVLAKVAKDAAAGSVLVCAVGAVLVALLVFGPWMLRLFGVSCC